jgi:hypothetical protein
VVARVLADRRRFATGIATAMRLDALAGTQDGSQAEPALQQFSVR